MSPLQVTSTSVNKKDYSYNAEIFLYKPREQRNHIFFNLKSSSMSLLAFSASFEYLCYGSTANLNMLLLQMSESDVYTSDADIYCHQILTSKVNPCTERVTALQSLK